MNKDVKVEKIEMLKGELTYWKYLYEIFWGGYKRTKALMPDKQMVRDIVDNMPYEPFGVPNKMTTVGKEDLIQKPDLATRKKRYETEAEEWDKPSSSF